MSMIGDDAWVDFAAGGGKGKFYNGTEADTMINTGNRLDGRNLLSEAADAGVTITETRSEFLGLDSVDG